MDNAKENTRLRGAERLYGDCVDCGHPIAFDLRFGFGEGVWKCQSRLACL